MAGQGQSECTEWKIRGLGAAFYINLTIAAKKAPSAKYLHFDLNSGSGYNCEAGVPGSPLAFLDAVSRSAHPAAYSHFVDHDKRAIEILLKREEIVGRKDCYAFHADNKDFIESIPDILRLVHHAERWHIGSILCDPNGTDVPFKELGWLLNDYPRLDLIVNWNATSVKRCRTVHGSEIPRVADLPGLFNKKHWLIRKPSGPWQFALLIGRNIQVNEHRAMGFYHLDGDMGRSIVHRLDNTAKEPYEPGAAQLAFL